MANYSRRQILRALAVAGPSCFIADRLFAQIPDTFTAYPEPYPDAWLPPGIRSRFVNNVNGLRMHVLEAGYEPPARPALVLLHGFPELAYSWRKVMTPLAEAGYHVIVPDLRGYGRTTGWSSDYDTDLTPFRMLNKVRDVVGLVYAYGYDLPHKVATRRRRYRSLPCDSCLIRLENRYGRTRRCKPPTPYR